MHLRDISCTQFFLVRMNWRLWVWHSSPILHRRQLWLVQEVTELLLFWVDNQFLLTLLLLGLFHLIFVFFFVLQRFLSEQVFQIRVRWYCEAPRELDRYVETFVRFRLVFRLSDNSPVRQHHVSLLMAIFSIHPVVAIQAELLHLKSFKCGIMVCIPIFLAYCVVHSL